jgi:hypothetical protein
MEGSGSVFMTNGSECGSEKPENIGIRIPNTACTGANTGYRSKYEEDRFLQYLLVESMSESADESRLELPISLSASRIYLSDIRAHFRLLIIQPFTVTSGFLYIMFM